MVYFIIHTVEISYQGGLRESIEIKIISFLWKSIFSEPNQKTMTDWIFLRPTIRRNPQATSSSTSFFSDIWLYDIWFGETND